MINLGRRRTRLATFSPALAFTIVASLAVGVASAADCTTTVGADDSIQAAVTAAVAGATICVDAGTFNESVTIDKALTLEGVAGAGSTTISPSAGHAIHVTGAIGAAATVHIEGFTLTAPVGTGLRVSSTTVLGTLSLGNSVLSGSHVNGLGMGSGAPGLDNVAVSDTTFTGNGSSSLTGDGDVSLFLFTGDASFTNVTITGGVDGDYAFQLRGASDCGAPTAPVGIVALSDVSISGSYNKPPLYVQCYTDLAGMSFSDVTVDGPADSGWAEFFVGSIQGGTATPTLDLGNTDFTGEHLVNVSLAESTVNLRVDADSVLFDGDLASSDPFAAEDATTHKLDDDTGRGLVTFVTGNVYVTSASGSIQRGVDAAASGDTVNVAAGSYDQTVDVTSDGVTIAGVGDATVISVVGGGTGVTVAADGITLEDLRIDKGDAAGGDDGKGIEVTGTTVSDLAVDAVTVTGATNGLRVGSATTLDGLTVTDSHFDGNEIGWYLAKETAASGDATVTNVDVSETTFSDNTRKGLYAEKLENAVFDGITVADSGTFRNYGFNNGIDINLKWDDYEDIEIRDSTVTGSGLRGGATLFDPAGIAIKARNDGSYASTPATLTGVTLDKVTVSGGVVGVRFGEEGKGNAGPTNVTVTSSSLSGTGGVALANETLAMVDATDNWWGSAAGPVEGAVLGEVGTDPWCVNPTCTTPEPDPEPEPEPDPDQPPGEVVEEADEEAGENETVSTDPEGAGPSVEKPVVSKVTTPNGGRVAIKVIQSPPADDDDGGGDGGVGDPSGEPDDDEAEESGFRILDYVIDIEAPPATPEAPLVLDFQLDESLFVTDDGAGSGDGSGDGTGDGGAGDGGTSGSGGGFIQVFRNGEPVATCADPDAGVAEPDPCVIRSDAGGIAGLRVLTSQASVWTFATITGGCPAGLVPEDDFGDVAAGAEHESSVDCLDWWGLTDGIGVGRFGPTLDVTRGQMASFVARLLTEAGVVLADDPADAFGDDDASVHELAINQLAAAGVIEGVSADRFVPGRPVTRAETATMLVGAYAAIAGEALPEGPDAFGDDDGSVHADNIDAAAAAGITEGVTATMFAPQQVSSRGEMASLLVGVLDVLVADGIVVPPIT